MSVSEKDREILDVVHACQADPYGVPVREALKERGRNVSYGWLYSKMGELEERNLVRSEEAPGGPKRGGRPKRLWFLTGHGLAAIREGGGT